MAIYDRNRRFYGVDFQAPRPTDKDAIDRALSACMAEFDPINPAAQFMARLAGELELEGESDLARRVEHIMRLDMAAYENARNEGQESK